MIKDKNSQICYIGLGSNLNDPIFQVNSAINEISMISGVILLKKSSLYKTKPVGMLEQPDFINAVIKVSTTLTPSSLLFMLMKIENIHKRKRYRNRNMPRTLDLDILYFSNRRIKTKILEVPHPRITERDFVLFPLNEIDPFLVKKIFGKIDFTHKIKLNKLFLQNSDNIELLKG